MKEFFSSVKFKILICVFALLLGFMIYSAITFGSSTVTQSIIDTITQPFVSVSTTISDWINETIDKFSNADKYQQENELLREQLSEMYTDVIEKEKLEQENEMLREMLKIAEEHEDFEWSTPCTITARTASDIFGGFTINRGSNDGLEQYDPVFTSIGLVGVISEIAPSYSRVTTILSTDINIGVITADSKVVAVIENDIEYSEQGYCLMSYIPIDSGIKVGEVVITSGSVIFPEGLIVGTIEEIITDDNGLSVHALIKPIEDVYNIGNVFAITEFYGQGEITD